MKPPIQVTGGSGAGLEFPGMDTASRAWDH